MLHDRFLMTESKKPLTILLASPRGFCVCVVEKVRTTKESTAFKLPRQLVA